MINIWLVGSIFWFLAAGANGLLNSTVQWPLYVKYKTVTGYFLQDDPSTNATTFNYVRLFTHTSYSIPLIHPRQTPTLV
jgi:hypothetical protein